MLIASIESQPGARLPGTRRLAARRKAAREGLAVSDALWREIEAL
jgi:(2R)-3-sulfolactate dehydrogenase (NADP+)